MLASLYSFCQNLPTCDNEKDTVCISLPHRAKTLSENNLDSAVQNEMM